MSDSFQSYVFWVEPEKRAPDVGEAVSDWLIEAGVMSRDIFDNVLGSGEGHIPGEKAGNFVEAGMSETRRLAINGVEIRVGRAVETTNDGVWSIACPECQAAFGEEDAQFGQVMDALGVWSEGRQAGVVCESCGRTSEIADWDFGSKLVVGNVIACFWNWPKHRGSLREGLEQAAGLPSRIVVGRI